MKVHAVGVAFATRHDRGRAEFLHHLLQFFGRPIVLRIGLVAQAKECILQVGKGLVGGGAEFSKERRHVTRRFAVAIRSDQEDARLLSTQVDQVLLSLST